MTQVLFNENQFLASLADDKELARELLDAFLADSPERAAELRAAVADGDAERISKLAHSLKGMCGVVRAEELAALSLKMEHMGRDGRLESVQECFTTFSDALEKATALMHAYLARH